MIAEKINSPEDLKSLSLEELNILAGELRKIIIETVSSNGGHLASNLGVVELAIAIHYVFDSPGDKIVWDVGHQSYSHKLLTGRYKRFHTLRKYEGISGFPKMSESPHDAFGAGHSSTSISAALGILEARDLKSESGKVIAVIGDGGMTSGLAFEGLNNAGHLGKDLIVVLNNNEMFISPKVGALSVHLSKVLKEAFYEKGSNRILAIEKSVKMMVKPKKRNKGDFLSKGVFKDFGFHCIGPVDGHNISFLIESLRRAKTASGPTLIHAVTKKGKGYKFSESDPCTFHGINPFFVKNGLQKDTAGDGCVSFSKAFGEAILEIGQKRKEVVAITAAMKEGVGLSRFSEKFPKRFYDTGIAESHAVAFAAGLASRGMRPVVAIYSTFLQRAYDQIIHDVCLQNLPVIFAIDRAGIVGEDGPTHHGLFDISFLRAVPNLTLMAPKDPAELKDMLAFAIDCSGPVALRYPRGRSESLIKDRKIEMGKSEILVEGKDVAIFALGSMILPSLKAAKLLKSEKIDPSVVNARFIKPLDEDLIVSLAKKTGKIVTVEENALSGGFGSAVLECLDSHGLKNVKVKRIGVNDKFINHGSQSILREKCGLDEKGIYSSVSELFRK